MRFDRLEAAEWEIIFMFRDMSRFHVSTLHIYAPLDNSVITPTRNEKHTVHVCEHRSCPISCRLCKRLCSGDHLHGLAPNQGHLCGCVCYFPFKDAINVSLLDKNTPVVPCVLPPAYAK
jgi:hypothetical protein